MAIHPARPRLPSRGFPARLADDSVVAEALRLLSQAYARLDELQAPVPPVRFPERERGRAPTEAEDPLGAWAWFARVRGAGAGRLAGKRVAVKDNTAVAGVPMQAGSRVLESYVPPFDATIVDRLLEAGADVLGKSTCEELCFSGGSHTSATGPLRNPYDRTRMAGGSSGGSAALVAVGEVDIATGTDQGGSIAIPSAWCGVVGIKPTFGLVPYTGILPVEWSIDHPGVIARNVADAALALETIAGPDGMDPRQWAAPPREPYADAADATRAPRHRVALLHEAFGWPGISDARVDALVQARVREALGASRVTTERAPLHRDAVCVMAAVSNEGAHRTLFHGAPTGPPAPGLHLPGLAEAWGRGLALHEDSFAPTVRAMRAAGAYAADHWHGAYYAKAQGLRMSLAAEYERALTHVAAIAMPAVPFLPRAIPADDAPAREVVDAGFQSHNTAAFDLTGHPTLTLPVGEVDGLPVGMMLVARRGGERALIALGAEIERALGKTTA